MTSQPNTLYTEQQIKNRADDLWLFTNHRLCVFASGSFTISISQFLTLMSVSHLHLGQNRGKLINRVFSYFITCLVSTNRTYNPF
jgi:hypothetical protein